MYRIDSKVETSSQTFKDNYAHQSEYVRGLKEKLEREVERLKAKEPQSETDEVLALLEPNAAR